MLANSHALANGLHPPTPAEIGRSYQIVVALGEGRDEYENYQYPNTRGAHLSVGTAR